MHLESKYIFLNIQYFLCKHNLTVCPSKKLINSQISYKQFSDRNNNKKFSIQLNLPSLSHLPNLPNLPNLSNLPNLPILSHSFCIFNQSNLLNLSNIPIKNKFFHGLNKNSFSYFGFQKRNYQKSVTPTLYCAATPIGNLGDSTDRLKEYLEAIPNIACENTLTTIKLMHALDIPTKGKKLIQYAESKQGETFSDKKIQSILQLLDQGQDCIYISEAGSPCISDPGFRLVNQCHERGYRVSVLPGASSIIAALMISGLNGNKFVFEGFLDKRQKRRLDTLQSLFNLGRTVVLFENPTRLRSTLMDIETVYGPEATVAICKELTKKHEEVIRGRISQFKHLLPENAEIKGEIVIVIEGHSHESNS